MYKTCHKTFGHWFWIIFSNVSQSTVSHSFWVEKKIRFNSNEKKKIENKTILMLNDLKQESVEIKVLQKILRKSIH